MPTFQSEELNGFDQWFEKNYSSQMFPYNGRNVSYNELPANMRAMTFTQALHQFVDENKANG